MLETRIINHEELSKIFFGVLTVDVKDGLIKTNRFSLSGVTTIPH